MSNTYINLYWLGLSFLMWILYLILTPLSINNFIVGVALASMCLAFNEKNNKKLKTIRSVK